MKKINRQIAGIVLVVAAVVIGAVIQWLGPGLVVREHPPLPSSSATAQGFTVVASIERVSYHFALIPLVLVGFGGLVLAVIPKRNQGDDV